MVSESFAVRQAIRLCSLLAGDGSDILQEELVEALRSASLNDDHCVRVTSEWIKHNKFRPMPAELYRLAEATPAFANFAKADKKCSGCAGTGWEQQWELVTNHKKGDSVHTTTERITDGSVARDLRARVDGKQQRIYEGVIRCTHCNYGRAMAAEAEQRNTGAA